MYANKDGPCRLNSPMSRLSGRSGLLAMMSQQVTVYRIQDCLGRGPYRRHHLENDLWAIKDSSFSCDYHFNHPTPWEDGLKDRPENYIFGFADTMQVNEWFSPSMLKEMADHDIHLYRIVIISRDYVLYGKRQCCFNPNAIYSQRRMY